MLCPTRVQAQALRKRNKGTENIWDAYVIINTSYPCKALIIIKTYKCQFHGSLLRCSTQIFTWALCPTLQRVGAHTQTQSLSFFYGTDALGALTKVPPLHHAAGKALNHTSFRGNGWTPRLAWGIWGVGLGLQIPRHVGAKSLDQDSLVLDSEMSVIPCPQLPGTSS